MKCRCLCLFAGLVLAACDAPRIPPVEPAEIRFQADVLTDTTRQGPAHDFVLPTLEGDSLRLSDFHGQVVVLNFWATWCAPCRMETPALIALHNALQPHGLTVIGVALDSPMPLATTEPKELVRLFTERLGVPYPILLGTRAITEAYDGVWTLPTTYVIDQKGQIVLRVMGMLPVDEVRPTLNALLGVTN